MKSAASAFFFRSEYDDFLFAPIGEDKNGKRLCVLSALARLDLAPWHEAAELTLLPDDSAIQRLALLIAALPDGSMPRTDPGTAAARLIALLPGRARSRDTLLYVDDVMKVRAAAIYVSLIFIVLISLAISRLLPAASVDNSHSSNIARVTAMHPHPQRGPW
jgi:hypothetical protein